MDGSTTTLLVIDNSPTDREALKAAVGDAASEIHVASSIEEAWEKAQSLDNLSAFVAGIPEEGGQSIFELRDQLKTKFGDLPGAFCSRSDMSAYYENVGGHEMLFYKPVDQQVMHNWVSEVTGKFKDEKPPITDDTAAISPDLVNQTPTHDLPEGPLPLGTVLGDYELKQVIQSSDDFALYEAEQKSVQRDVAIKLLYRKHRKDPVWVGAFVEEARARALINHPAISLVYEAAQEFGVNFYTLELIDSPSLDELANRRTMLDDDTLWKVLESTTDAFCYLKATQMRHRVVTPQTIFLVNGEQVRIANPVKGSGSMLTVEEELAQLKQIGEAIRPFLRQGKTDPALFTIYERLTQNRIDSLKTFEALKDALTTTESTPVISEAEKARIEEQQSNRNAIIYGGLIGGILLIAGLIAFLVGNKPAVRDLDVAVKVPGGSFTYQTDQTVDVPDFWMDQFEVTIAQYAEFLADLAANPAKKAEVTHPAQPEDKKSFVPLEWDDMYAAAQKGGSFKGVKIDPNFPIVNVDWWDAYAYARWKGRRLPTEQEWEKTARGGRNGYTFPWGNEIDMTFFNSGGDKEETTVEVPDEEGNMESKKVGPGGVDGYKYWAPVDDHPKDECRYGIRNLAGNVTEWTASWDTHPSKPDTKVPLKRGASFNTKDGFEVIVRRSSETPSETNLWTGFRTIADSDPEAGETTPPPHQILPPGAADVKNAAAPAPVPDSSVDPGAAGKGDAPAPDDAGKGESMEKGKGKGKGEDEKGMSDGESMGPGNE